MTEPAIPVTIVTGFLGAGKSTLVQRWLQELPRHETAVIVNERGEVGIDGELLAAYVTQLREITGGCVCCKTHAELVNALTELGASTPRPTRILIETSGAASPAGVIRALSAQARERLVLDGVVTVLDVVRAERALELDVAVEQLGFADVVVLSHTDEAGADAPLEHLQERISRHAPAAVIARATRQATSARLLELLAQRAEALHVWPEGSGHTSIDAAALVLDGELDEERFGDWVESTLADVEARILRIKGILAMQGVDARVIVQGISDAVEVQLGAPWGDGKRTSRLVILGLGLDSAALQAGFSSCAAETEALSAEASG